MSEMLKEQQSNQTQNNQGVGSQTLGYICPICVHNKYTEIKRNNGIMGPGGRSWIVGCVCDGCTVQFKDVKCFTKNRQI